MLDTNHVKETELPGDKPSEHNFRDNLLKTGHVLARGADPSLQNLPPGGEKNLRWSEPALNPRPRATCLYKKADESACCVVEKSDDEWAAGQLHSTSLKLAGIRVTNKYTFC